MSPRITIRGARQHNLKNVDLDLPKNELIVITGPSGCGKSSLAFDTIFAEGQRRYVESLSTYARQFLGQMPKPDVDSIEGLGPAISVEQEGRARSARSTIGTVTEIHDYLRLLYARAGEVRCVRCGHRILPLTITSMIDRVLEFPEGERILVLAPVAAGKGAEIETALDELRKQGFVRARIDGDIAEISAPPQLSGSREHTLELVVDRLIQKPGVRERLADALQLATRIGNGLVRIVRQDGSELLWAERNVCVECGTSMPQIEPRLFSFNSPTGACPACDGLGEAWQFDEERVIPDGALSIADGAVEAWGKSDGPFYEHMLSWLSKHSKKKDVVTPWKKLTASVRARLLHGEGEFAGILGDLTNRSREYGEKRNASADGGREVLQDLQSTLRTYASHRGCGACHGARLRPEALAVKVGNRSIAEIESMELGELTAFLRSLKWDPAHALVGERLVSDIVRRVAFLNQVGLSYLPLSRSVVSLSGGEHQRVRLATQIGAGLSGVVYVLDEPSVGLHPIDMDALLGALRALVDAGNSVIIVEHDEAAMRAANTIVEMGPGAGKSGGYVLAVGPPDALARDESSSIGRYLSRKAARFSSRSRKPTGEIELRGARANNLKSVGVHLPLGVLCAVSGPSGSGKSSLVFDCLVAGVIHGASAAGVCFDSIRGAEKIERVVVVDQAPIGRTPRSTPASYVGLLPVFRDLFASLPEARARGYTASRFSFNVKGGRCEACGGDGVERIPMQFLADMFVTCTECQGRRFNRETLDVRYRGLDIAQVLALSVNEARDVFANIPQAITKLEALHHVGLGYLELGQNSATLSGGEAQRVKLARELARRVGEGALYVLDEPTTGLHFTDIEVLVGVLEALVDAGHSVVCIEHNLDFLARCDWIIELGPGAGPNGGNLIGAGSPAEIAASSSATGVALRAFAG